MGTYVNPGNEGFARILRSKYVDKTGLIALFDETIDSAQGLVMVSRPRRFGKSFAAHSLVAFYSCGCDSRALFEGLEVSRREDWDERLNAYNVVCLDMAGVIEAAGSHGVAPTISKLLLPELREVVADAGIRDSLEGIEGIELKKALLDVARETGRKFVFVIDEWDAPYRLAKDDRAAQDAYAEWLRGLFKDLSFTPDAVAGAYLTGILPIKKYAHQSAVSDFDEYTMLDSAKYAPFVGFTRDEVKALCDEYELDMADVQRWYDGYELRYRRHNYDIFAPYSLMRACQRGRTGSYWPSTETFESLREYVDMDFDGLQGDVLRAVAGEELLVDTGAFQNDLVSMRGRDDVLTLLVHLGYLSYDSDSHRARVPNEEVRAELRRAVEGSSHKEVARIVRESVQLVDDVLEMDEEAVAAGIARAHDTACTPLYYNNEQSLRAVVRAALLAAADDWARIEELPSGRGFADVVYLPKRGSSKPALLVELKWDRPVQTAIEQIHAKDYPALLRDLDVPILLVGVTYGVKTKEHVCQIELLEC